MYRVPPIHRFAAHLPTGMGFDKGAKALAHYLVVIGDQDAKICQLRASTGWATDQSENHLTRN